MAGYDDYFHLAKAANRIYLQESEQLEFVGLSRADVTCVYCGYSPRSNVIRPRTAYRVHMKKHHQVEYRMSRVSCVIVEEPDV